MFLIAEKNKTCQILWRDRRCYRRGAETPKHSTNSKMTGLRFVLLQDFNKAHLITTYMTKPLMAGYTSVNGQ